MVTVIHLVQIESRNGLETDKVKDGYRLCGFLPQPPTSHLDIGQFGRGGAAVSVSGPVAHVNRQ